MLKLLLRHLQRPNNSLHPQTPLTGRRPPKSTWTTPRMRLAGTVAWAQAIQTAALKIPTASYPRTSTPWATIARGCCSAILPASRANSVTSAMGTGQPRPPADARAQRGHAARAAPAATYGTGTTRFSTCATSTSDCWLCGAVPRRARRTLCGGHRTRAPGPAAPIGGH